MRFEDENDLKRNDDLLDPDEDEDEDAPEIEDHYNDPDEDDDASDDDKLTGGKLPYYLRRPGEPRS